MEKNKIVELRRANLKKWFADKTVPTDEKSYVSQLIGGSASFGEKAARRLESVFQMPSGYLINPEASITSQEIQSTGKSSDEIHIPLFDVSFSMGQGAFQQDYEDIISAITVTNEWVNTNLPNITSAHNLRIGSGRGDSMLGTYSHGDMLFIDCGVIGVPFDGVYAFMLNDQLYVKRLQKRPDGGYNMISDNKQYDTFIITKNDRIHVFGRVVWAWNGKRL